MIGISLLNHNGVEDTTVDCLVSLTRFTPGDWHISILDNGSSPIESLKMKNCIQSFLPDGCWSYEYSGDNVGIPVGRNITFRKLIDLGADYICVIHQDHVFSPGWLGALVEYAEGHPKCGVVGSNSISDKQYTYTDMSSWAQWAQAHRSISSHSGNAQPCLYRASMMQDIGLYTEPWGKQGYEDWDFNRRAMNAGWTIDIYNDSLVYHKGSTVRSNMDDSGAEMRKSAGYYFKAWGDYTAPV